MNCIIAQRTIVVLFMTTLYLSLAATAQAESPACSLALTAGKWGFSTSGAVVDIGPRSSLGIFTLDAAGNLLNGKATASLNGSVTDEIFSGTYTVNPDCTGKLAIGISDSSGSKILTATLDLVFDENGEELHALFTSAALPDGTPLATVITVEAKRIFLQGSNQQSIADNTPRSLQTVSFDGTGTVVQLNPSSLNFGLVTPGKYKILTTTLTNVGSTTLNISSITITGTDADEFHQINNCGSSLGAGTSCTITVTFIPKEFGGDSAYISISDNGGGSPQQVSLQGYGWVMLK